jgi:outer membrane protein assembly factor BamD (BamD/ComL family)
MSMRRCCVLWILLVAAGCVSSPGDNRIKNIEQGDLDVHKEQLEQGVRNKAIESYRTFLEKEEHDPLRAEAMRRLADLQLEKSEADYLQKAKQLEQAGKGAETLQPGDYSRAIETYRELLRTHPNYVGNDQVIYQLAHAYEQNGDYQQALHTLGRLVALYPNAKFVDEVQFRRGELYFLTNAYRNAERAYGAVLRFGDASVYYERALYKRGWSLFKQSQYEAALDSFVILLDRKLVVATLGQPVKQVSSPTTADKELISDTFRVVTLTFSHLGGPEAVTAYFKGHGSRPYEATLYEHLGALYLKQERYVDAANAFKQFIKQYGMDGRAPLFQLQVIGAYKQGGFPTLLLKAKEEFVVRYGVGSVFWNSQDAQTHATITPQLKSNVEELARHFHAQAQRSKSSADYGQAIRWYAEFVRSFASDARAPKMNFLLAETLFEAGRYGDAAIQYETTAYDYAPHADSAEAGYAALLAYKKREEQLRGSERATYQRRAIASALRFGDVFAEDKRAAAVLSKAAEDLYALHELDQATTAARRVVAMKPLAPQELRRTAWTVIAHAQFERQAYVQAEAAYQEVLALMSAGAPQRNAIVERLASSVYKQGEQLRANDDQRGAVAQFLRVRKVAPGSSVTAIAEYDAAAALITLKDWRNAVNVLEDFRRQYPDHPLQRDVPEKLAAAYLEGGQWSQAAALFEEIADRREDSRLRQEALWQAAELYEKAERKDAAARVYQHYVSLPPNSFERATEARFRLASIFETMGQSTQYYYWLSQIVDAADRNQRGATARTQYLAAKAGFLLGEHAYQEFSDVRLVIPLQQSLKAKKQRMEIALKAYKRAADYGVAEFTTAATFRIAEVYNRLSRDLLASERPQGLSPLELEQYNVLLEEQAFPFEEKATAIHETNVHRVVNGVYDEWVKKSFEQLGKLRPVRYAKAEKSEAVSSDIR